MPPARKSAKKESSGNRQNNPSKLCRHAKKAQQSVDATTELIDDMMQPEPRRKALLHENSPLPAPPAADADTSDDVIMGVQAVMAEQMQDFKSDLIMDDDVTMDSDSVNNCTLVMSYFVGPNIPEYSVQDGTCAKEDLYPLYLVPVVALP